MDFLQQPSPKCTLPIWDDLDEEEEDFQKVSLERMAIALQKKFWIDIYAYMNIQYCINYVHTYAQFELHIFIVLWHLRS